MIIHTNGAPGPTPVNSPIFSLDPFIPFVELIVNIIGTKGEVTRSRDIDRITIDTPGPWPTFVSPKMT